MSPGKLRHPETERCTSGLKMARSEVLQRGNDNPQRHRMTKSMEGAKDIALKLAAQGSLVPRLQKPER
jgi:hypothetical protein